MHTHAHTQAHEKEAASSSKSKALPAPHLPEGLKHRDCMSLTSATQELTWVDAVWCYCISLQDLAIHFSSCWDHWPSMARSWVLSRTSINRGKTPSDIFCSIGDPKRARAPHLSGTALKGHPSMLHSPTRSLRGHLTPSFAENCFPLLPLYVTLSLGQCFVRKLHTRAYLKYSSNV